MATQIIKTKNSIAYDDALIAPLYKPRYVFDEAQSLVQQEQRSLLLFSCSSCSWWCFAKFLFGSRRRSLVTLSVVISYVSIFHAILVDSVVQSINIGGYSLARNQSFHFFEDIPSSKWNLLRKRVHRIRKKQKKQKEQKSKRHRVARKFYQHNYPAEFTCSHEQRVGGMKGGGGKWLCDPENIAKASSERKKKRGNGCLVYTSYADLNDLQFEKSLLELLGGECEIHVFHPNVIPEDVNSPIGIHVHPWGFRSTRSNNADDTQLKTLQETAENLGHEGFTVDLLALDCEGCEFDIYEDLVRGHLSSNPMQATPVFMQILIEIHSAPTQVDSLFQVLQSHGYVIFHKSPGSDGTGEQQDYGFLKLSQDFFIE